MNPACDRIELLLPAHLAGELSAEEAALVRTHLETCSACRETAESLRLLAGAMTLSPLPDALEPARVEAIKAHFASLPHVAAPLPRADGIWSRVRRWWDGEGAEPSLLASLGRLAVFVLIPLVLLLFTLPGPHGLRPNTLAFLSVTKSSDETMFDTSHHVVPPATPPADAPVAREALGFQRSDAIVTAAEPVPAPTAPARPALKVLEEDSARRLEAVKELPAVAGQISAGEQSAPQNGRQREEKSKSSAVMAGKPGQPTVYAGYAAAAAAEPPAVAHSLREPKSEVRETGAVLPKGSSAATGWEVNGAASRSEGEELAKHLADADEDGRVLNTFSDQGGVALHGLYEGRSAGGRAGGGGGGAVQAPAGGTAVGFGYGAGGFVAGGKQRGNRLEEKRDDLRAGAASVPGEQPGLGDDFRVVDGRKSGERNGATVVSGPASGPAGGASEWYALSADRKAVADKVALDGVTELSLSARVQDLQKSKESLVGRRFSEAKPDAADGGVAAAPAKQEEMEALRTEIPRPMFVGTPIPIKLPNMEPPNASPITDRFAREERAKKAQLASSLHRDSAQQDVSKLAKDGTGQLNFSGTSTVSGGTLSNLAADAPRPAPPRQPAGFNPYVEAASDAFSTFAIDVDTASYTLTRRALDEGRLPDPEQVRSEEIVNAFDQDYTPPARGAFALHAALAPSPFRSPLDLLRVGIQGALPGRDAKKAAVLTLVIDASGSMDTPDRLGRIRTALRLLAGKLQPQDSVAVVAFGNEPRLLLDRTPGTNPQALVQTIDQLSAAGSTQLEGGLRLGYEVAARGFVSGAANRVILLSDGVANLGAATAQEILASVEQFRRQGIYLTVLGFGSGNYDDAMLMNLADKGDGMYAFVDSDAEARRLLVEQWEQTMHVIARDAKIQLEFNPDRVVRWRQIGYEKRQLRKQDFRNDSIDAGEVGSGQSVTALYDVELRAAGTSGPVDAHTSFRGAIATLRVRYQDPDTGRVTELERRITDADRVADFARAAPRFRVAACAAEFSELLRVSPYSGGSDFGAVVEKLRPAAAELPLDQRVQELLRMAERARSLAQ